MRQERDLTKGAIVKSLWLFALPLMFGNVLQQFYNLDRKSTRLNSSHMPKSRMPSSA